MRKQTRRWFHGNCFLGRSLVDGPVDVSACFFFFFFIVFKASLTICKRFGSIHRGRIFVQL